MTRTNPARHPGSKQDWHQVRLVCALHHHTTRQWARTPEVVAASGGRHRDGKGITAQRCCERKRRRSLQAHKSWDVVVRGSQLSQRRPSKVTLCRRDKRQREGDRTIPTSPRRDRQCLLRAPRRGGGRSSPPATHFAPDSISLIELHAWNRERFCESSNRPKSWLWWREEMTLLHSQRKWQAGRVPTVASQHCWTTYSSAIQCHFTIDGPLTFFPRSARDTASAMFCFWQLIAELNDRFTYWLSGG